MGVQGDRWQRYMTQGSRGIHSDLLDDGSAGAIAADKIQGRHLGERHD